ncbi:MAG: hypothetical protein IIT52_05760, partial [Candidatus Methanomethylophilus sp.]|nr:hypothetical protein [Methanomethylophilus sp.]
CNGELYVVWIEIPDVEGILSCTILANYDVQGPNQIPIGNVGELPLPDADALLSRWDRDGAVPVSLNTRSDGFGTRYELGATLTENDLNSMQRHALYVIWQVEELLGYINANFDGANPETISGEIDGDLMELPDLEQLPWDRTADGYTVFGFNSASDGSGNDYDLGGDITREQVLALDEHTLYVIWGVTGYIFANTNAEDERYISAVIPTCGMELPSNLPWANPGQVVAYYCTTSDGEGEHYNPGDLIYADDVLSLDSHILYVIWAAED